MPFFLRHWPQRGLSGGLFGKFAPYPKALVRQESWLQAGFGEQDRQHRGAVWEGEVTSPTCGGLGLQIDWRFFYGLPLSVRAPATVRRSPKRPHAAAAARDPWTFGPVDPWTLGPLDPWTLGPLGPLDPWALGPVDAWTLLGPLLDPWALGPLDPCSLGPLGPSTYSS